MSPQYPYQAQALMRFKAQDGQFILSANQLVTVTGPVDEDGEWVNVTDEQGAFGSVPTGFLIKIEAAADTTAKDDTPPPAIEAGTPANTPLPPPSDPTKSVERTSNQMQTPPLTSNLESPPSAVTKPQTTTSLAQSLPTSDFRAIEPLPPAAIKPETSSIANKIAITPLPSAENSSVCATMKPPPPPAAKPNALRDRIAMFNKPVANPAPPATAASRPKPPLARKPMAIPPPVPPTDAEQSNESTSAAPPSPSDVHSSLTPGMSAADAEESVRAGGSLKDRIRLLQQQQQQTPAPEAPVAPPKPKREWKRPPAPPTSDEAPLPLGMMPPPIQTLSSSGSQEFHVDGADSGPPQTGAELEDDEEEDAARRRRIAERMAKLGGAKMGFGFPGPALAPKPPTLSRSSTENVIASSHKEDSEDLAPVLPPERVAIPAMPKRAGPPRRKAPAPVSASDITEQPNSAQNAAVNTHDIPEPFGKLPGQPASQQAENVTSEIKQAEPSHNSDEFHDRTEESDNQPSQLDADSTDSHNGIAEPDHVPQSTEDHAPESSATDQHLVDPTESHEVDACEEPSQTAGGEQVAGMESFDDSQSRKETPVDGFISPVAQSDEIEVTPGDSNQLDRQSTVSEGLSRPASYIGDSEDVQPADLARQSTSGVLDDQVHSSNAEEHDPRPTSVIDSRPAIRSESDEGQSQSPSEAPDSFAKKMAAIGARPMMGGPLGMPPIVPLRRPSGPREPKSPLVSPSAEMAARGHDFSVSSDKERVPSDGALSEVALPKSAALEAASASRAQSDSENEPLSSPTGNNREEEIDTAEDDEDDEDEEMARRRRLAERMAKMGGRSMMGGMVPMFSPAGPPRSSTARRSDPEEGSPIPPARALPSPPTVPPPRLPSTDSSPAMASVPSPRRAAPHPVLPDSTSSQEDPPPPPIPIRRPSRSAPSNNPDAPAAPHSATPSLSSSPSNLSRPRIPSGYQNPPKRSSVLSQPGRGWSADEREHALSEESFVEEEAPPPVYPPQQPKRSVPSLPSTVNNVESSPQRHDGGGRDSPSYEPRSSSFDSTRSSTHRQAGLGNLDPPTDSPVIGSKQSKTQLSEPPSQLSYSSRSTFKARDLDLASERWWRSRPVATPRSVTSRNDVLVRLQGSSTLQKGKSIYQYELVVIRDDYSKTVVNITFDDNEDESGTEMNQVHYPPPPPYEISVLQELGQTLGPQIVARAKAKEDEKGCKVEDGQSMVRTIIESLEVALEPVGQTYGEVIYKCEIQDVKGAHPEIEVKDDIRPGDIVASYGATFKGKGIGHGSMNLGTVSNPHVAIVAEHDIKKNKFKAYGIWHGKVELMSYRLDELKSGSIKVYRVLDKEYLEH